MLTQIIKNLCDQLRNVSTIDSRKVEWNKEYRSVSDIGNVVASSQITSQAHIADATLIDDNENDFDEEGTGERELLKRITNASSDDPTTFGMARVTQEILETKDLSETGLGLLKLLCAPTLVQPRKFSVFSTDD